MIGVALVRIQEARALEAKNKSLNQRVREIQSAFRELVHPLYTDNIANVMSKQRLTSIASNFFVFQTVSEVNIERFLQTFESCRQVFDQCKLANTQNPEQFPKVFERLIDSIPTSARDFNANFYNVALPTIFEDFASNVEKLSVVKEEEEPSSDFRDYLRDKQFEGLNIKELNEHQAETQQPQTSVH